MTISTTDSHEDAAKKYLAAQGFVGLVLEDGMSVNAMDRDVMYVLPGYVREIHYRTLALKPDMVILRRPGVARRLNKPDVHLYAPELVYLALTDSGMQPLVVKITLTPRNVGLRPRRSPIGNLFAEPEKGLTDRLFGEAIRRFEEIEQ